jgi:hypothetical protein
MPVNSDHEVLVHLLKAVVVTNNLYNESSSQKP